MRILILGAGPAPDDLDVLPVWLAEREGQVLIERFVDACAPLGGKMVFAVRAQDMKRHNIDSVIKLADPDAAIIRITGETGGAACTALLCVHHILGDGELLILNSNEFLDIDYANAVDEFRSRALDAGIVTFRSLHPRYSYVRVDEDGLIQEAAEKRPISRHATAGFYWFRRGDDFIEAAQNMIRKDTQINGRFFISLVFNELVLKQHRMGIKEVDARYYHPLKSAPQLSHYETEVSEPGS